MSLSPAAQLMSPPVTWLRELKSDERGLYLIHLLLNCANHVAAGKLEHANACLEHISLLAAPDGDTMQRIASHFTEALARRVLRSWPGLYRALHPPSVAPTRPTPESLLARRHFFDLCPFVRLAFLVSNQAILEAMEGERVVHVVDLGGAASDAAQWAALLQALRARPEGPPHLRLTVVHDQKEFLDVAAMRLSADAERLDIPFQFHPVHARLDNLDVDMLRVKTGEALAISSVLQLHTLLAADDDAAGHQRKTPSPFTKNSNMSHLHRIVQMSHPGTLGELLEKDAVNVYSPSQDSASSSPLALTPSPKTESLLASLWGLSPKIMTVTEQESNHNGPMLTERFTEALNFYAALFDCVESTAPRMSEERARVEKMLFGEEIKNIITCEGTERRERHEKLEKWVQRLELAGFGRVPLSYFAMLQAKRLLQSYGCEGYKVREEKGFFFICWQERPLFSVSAWRFKRFE
ncbi:scarecrow-like protein 3 [Cocos nucifera]|nr:scarecrow-like protein 3 [Cocos nucifera]